MIDIFSIILKDQDHQESGSGRERLMQLTTAICRYIQVPMSLLNEELSQVNLSHHCGFANQKRTTTVIIRIDLAVYVISYLSQLASSSLISVLSMSDRESLLSISSSVDKGSKQMSTSLTCHLENNRHLTTQNHRVVK